MPLTLYGYILRELLKVLGTATLVLTVVMSVAFAIMSMSHGLLGPWALVKIIVYVLPGMLTIALPFSAALAGTLVFFRMSQDNEITACAVGGISYLGMLTPVLGLGLALTGGMFWFSNWVVPQFWRLAEREGTADAVRIVVGKIERREVFEWSAGDRKLMVHADAATLDVPVDTGSHQPGETRPYNSLILQGVAVGRLEEQSDAVHNVYTAGQAIVDLYRDEDSERGYATMLLKDVTGDDPKTGGLAHAAQLRLAAIEIPSQFSDRPRFMSLHRLQRLHDDPTRSAEVRQAKLELAEALARQRVLEEVVRRLGDGTRAADFKGVEGEEFSIVAPAAVMGDSSVSLRGRDELPVTVVRLLGKVRQSTYTAESGTLEFADTLTDEEPRLTLILNKVVVQYRDSPIGRSELSKVPLPMLGLGVEVLAPLRAAGLNDLMEEARGRESVNPIKKALRKVEKKVTELQRDIVSRVHERAATAVNCLLVLALGVVMSMWLRHQTPLAIFFWCFVPTVAAFLTISSGQQITGWEQLRPATGLAILWSGNIGLALIVVGVYARLRRN